MNGRFNAATGDHFIEDTTDSWKMWQVDGRRWWGRVDSENDFFYALAGTRDSR